MSFEEFKASLKTETAPEKLTSALEGLWHDGNGDWAQAHRCVQDDGSPEGAWVHAYLHRKEGDESNAAYWYRRADQPIASATLDEEWEQITRALLAHCTQSPERYL